MQTTICQSCGMPITPKEQMGLERDGSVSVDYCKYCYEKGELSIKSHYKNTYKCVLSMAHKQE